jgi:hypothetical protein
MDRRQFISVMGSMVGASVGASLLVGRPSRAGEWSKPVAAVESAQPYFGGLGPGVVVERWRLIAIGDVRDHAMLVEMATADGSRFFVEVMGRDPAFPGIAHTDQVDLYLCNQGDGASRSHEEHGLGALALARALSAREAAGAQAPQLLTLRQRAARLPRYSPLARV